MTTIVKLSLPDHTQLPAPNGESVKLTLPDHTQLPESNGEFVRNFQDHPQSVLLTDTIAPVRIHPDGSYCIGQDFGIDLSA